MAEPAAAPAAVEAAEKPKPPLERQRSAGKLAAPAGLGALIGGAGPPPGAGGGGGPKGPQGLGALIGGGGPPPKRAGGLKAPVGLGAMLGGPGGPGGLKAPQGLGAMLKPVANSPISMMRDGGDSPATPGVPRHLQGAIFDEPTTPVPQLDHSVAKKRANGPKTTPRRKRPSSRRTKGKRASLGTPPAMESPVPAPEPEAEGGLRKTTTTMRKRAGEGRAPIATSLEEEEEPEPGVERAPIASSLEEEAEPEPESEPAAPVE